MVTAEKSLLNRSLTRKSIAEIPPHPALTLLLRRLRSGQQWLTATFDQLDAGSSGGPLERQYFRAIEFWIDVEREVRELFNFQGCVIGQRGCHGDAPVNCEACVGKEQLVEVAV